MTVCRYCREELEWDGDHWVDHATVIHQEICVDDRSFFHKPAIEEGLLEVLLALTTSP